MFTSTFKKVKYDVNQVKKVSFTVEYTKRIMAHIIKCGLTSIFFVTPNKDLILSFFLIIVPGILRKNSRIKIMAENLLRAD